MTLWYILLAISAGFFGIWQGVCIPLFVVAVVWLWFKCIIIPIWKSI